MTKKICKLNIKLTSSPPHSCDLPDQNRCEHTHTPRHWSGFFKSFDAASAHCVLKGAWFSSLKHVILSNVAMINVIAASCALESLISSSYSEKACEKIILYILSKTREEFNSECFHKRPTSNIRKFLGSNHFPHLDTLNIWPHR